MESWAFSREALRAASVPATPRTVMAVRDIRQHRRGHRRTPPSRGPESCDLWRLSRVGRFAVRATRGRRRVVRGRARGRERPKIEGERRKSKEQCRKSRESRRERSSPRSRGFLQDPTRTPRSIRRPQRDVPHFCEPNAAPLPSARRPPAGASVQGVTKPGTTGAATPAKTTPTAAAGNTSSKGAEAEPIEDQGGDRGDHRCESREAARERHLAPNAPAAPRG